MPVSMRKAVAAVRDLFDSNNYHYDYDEENYKFHAKFNLSRTKLGSIDIYIRVRPSSSDPDNARLIISHGQVSLHGDKDCIAGLCEYITRANYGLNIGNFEMDHSDGELRYKVSINCVDALPGEDALDDLLTMPVSMFNKYGNGMLAVSMGMMSPADACRQAES